MPGRTDNSFTRPLPYCPTSTFGLTAVCPKSNVLRIYIGRSAPFFQTARAPCLVLQPPPEPAARRYIVSPRTESVTAGFLRATDAALHALPAPVRHSPRLLGVIARRYFASPRTEPVTAGFLRAAVAALHAQQHLCANHPDCSAFFRLTEPVSPQIGRAHV